LEIEQEDVALWEGVLVEEESFVEFVGSCGEEFLDVRGHAVKVVGESDQLVGSGEAVWERQVVEGDALVGLGGAVVGAFSGLDFWPVLLIVGEDILRMAFRMNRDHFSLKLFYFRIQRLNN